MWNIGYFKSQPTQYILRYTSGRITREGAGLAFFYLRYNTQIAAVPTSSQDVPFVFKETTSNFQEVAIQGQLTFRIANPKTAASLIDFSIDPARGTYITDDREKLAGRIANVVQIETRREIQSRSLEETLRDSQTIASVVLGRLREGDNVLQALGIELLSVYFLSTRPTPEVAKALEAEYRETLLRKADEAIYARRIAAVDEERKIKEREVESDKALEEQRRELLVIQGENSRQEAEDRGRATEIEAEYRARAAAAELAVYSGMDPQRVLAHSMRTLGENADRIGNLTITTELLAGLMNAHQAVPESE